MARYTYDQFRQSAQNAGLLNEFSQADLMEAQKDPDFGMTILKYKQDYHNATTDEGRARANYAANQYRSSRGGYTGGGDGGSFAQDWLSPRDFQYGSAPTYSNPYADDIADLWDQQKNFGDFTYEDAPVYNNRYDDEIQDLIQGILDRPDFSYDPETDLLYQQYRKQYNREGDRAVADALGAAAAASGGIPSSYANTAAAQAGNYYASQLTDKIPELYELAYNQYLNDYQMQLSDLGVVQGAEHSDYDKYLNALNQYNTDRNFAYNQYLNNYDIANNNLQTALGLQDSSFNQYLAALDQFTTDRNFSYGQLLDEIDNQTARRNEALNNAVLAGEYGDFSFLNNMGINTENNPMDWERQQYLDELEYNRAQADRDWAYQLEERNYNRKQQTQALAQAQVDDILAAGGTPPADLVQQAGYSQDYINALRGYYQNTSRSSTGRSGGNYGNSGGDNMTLTTAKQAANAGYFGDDVLNVLRDNGYNDEMISAIYGWDPVSAGTAMNEANFGAMARSIASSLAQIRSDADVQRLLGGLDGVWGRLSNDQKRQIQNLLDQYGYQYEE